MGESFLLSEIPYSEKQQSLKGLIFEIREFSLYDGPGIRTTVFLKGCPLRCVWCHNPEGLSPLPELLFSSKHCNLCGSCKRVSKKTEVDGNAYNKLQMIANSCPTGAKRLCGRYLSPQELFEELLSYKDIFISSGGGVTFSGGEPLLQVDFVVEAAKLLHQEGISVAVETSGYASREKYCQLLDNIDFIYQDIKHPNNEVHHKYTGVSNVPILQNIAVLKNSGKPYIVRIPLIPDVNDTEEDLTSVAEMFRSEKYLQMVELLPYHASSGGKYVLLGQNPPEIFEEKTFDSQILKPFIDRKIPARLL